MKNTIPHDNLGYSVFLSLDRGKSFGSGFRIKNNDINYLVTAKHVLYNESNQLRCKELVATCHTPELNSSDALIFCIEMEKAKIYFHDKSDIVAIRIGNLIKLYDHNIPLKFDTEESKRPTKVEFEDYVSIEQYPTAKMVSVDKEATRGIDEIKIANEVFLMGYPTSLGLENDDLFDRRKPLLRKGIIAGINKEKNTFIIDCPSYYGNSGGPIVEACEDSYYRVIGLVSRFIPFVTTWKNTREQVINTDISNSGYTICIPMNCVFDLLDNITQ